MFNFQLLGKNGSCLKLAKIYGTYSPLLMVSCCALLLKESIKEEKKKQVLFQSSHTTVEISFLKYLGK